MISLALGSSLPPALEAYVEKALANGAAPLPNVKLNTQLPTAGPVVMDNGGAFTVTIYGAALMKFSLQAKPGKLLAVTA